MYILTFIDRVRAVHKQQKDLKNTIQTYNECCIQYIDHL